MACRNLTKGEDARKKIVASTDKSSANATVEVWPLDLSSYSSVLAFGERMNTLTRLDAFIANAGQNTIQYEEMEGNESLLTVNVISTFLVGMLAIPKLRETGDLQKQQLSRLVFVGSVVHIFAKDQYLREPPPGKIFQNLNDESTADMNDRYHLTKLLVLLGVRKLAKKVDGGSKEAQRSVIVNCVNPGWCKTELFRTHDGGLGGRIGLALIGRTAEQGSRTLVHAAVADADSHGRYLSECRVKPESTFVRSDAGVQVEERIWSELVEILEMISPGVTDV